MKPHYALSATLVAGLAIGVALTTALLAQSTPPAYVVADVAIHDADAFSRDYAPKVAGTVQSYGGRFLTSEADRTRRQPAATVCDHCIRQSRESARLV